MSEWSYIWEIKHEDAGIINPNDFWKPTISMGKVVAYRWRNMSLMLRDDPAIETHAVFRRPIPGTPFVQLNEE